MKLIILLTLFLPHLIYANDCHELKESRIRLNTAAFNYLNVNTTRTAEGGPYLIRKIKKCAKGKCEVVKGSSEYDTILKYEPNHPDALNIGYVRYPLIDGEKEFATANSRAHHLILLAEKKACGTKLSKTKGSEFYELKYGKRFPNGVKADRFLFIDHQLKSLEVEFRDGTTSITTF